MTSSEVRQKSGIFKSIRCLVSCWNLWAQCCAIFCEDGRARILHCSFDCWWDWGLHQHLSGSL